MSFFFFVRKESEFFLETFFSFFLASLFSLSLSDTLTTGAVIATPAPWMYLKLRSNPFERTSSQLVPAGNAAVDQTAGAYSRTSNFWVPPWRSLKLFFVLSCRCSKNEEREIRERERKTSERERER